MSPAKSRPFDAERALLARRRAKVAKAFGDEAASNLDIHLVAQDFAYQAMEAGKASEALVLARKAMELDGECTDAQVLLAKAELASPRALAKEIRLIASRAESRLGTPFLQQFRGKLWEIVEARPFLRAKASLAEALERAGKSADAILHLEALLAMDPADHLKARLPLVRCYLSAGKLQSLEPLLKKDADFPFMAWATVLARLKAGNEKAARKALERARKIAPLVEDFLTGRQKLPRKQKPSHEPGPSEIAAATLKLFGELWNNDREAMYWLFKQDR